MKSKNKIAPNKEISRIAEEAMCIGCGLCQSIAGKDVLQLKMSKSGCFYPHLKGDISDEAVNTILDTCPSHRLQGIAKEDITQNTKVDWVWGAYQSLLMGYATNPQHRFEGATGGALTALSSYLLSSGRVDFILHVKASKEDPVLSKSHISYTEADILEAVGSRYAPAAPLIDIKDVLDRGQKFAFIGKPCDVSALRNYARHDPRVHEQVKYYLTFSCGGFMPLEGVKSFLSDMDVNSEDVASLRYRGRGFPGPVTINTKNGTEINATYYDFWGKRYDRWTAPHRCKVCPDSIGEAADVMLADPWPGGGPNLEDTSDRGTNLIMTRTDKGDELVKAAQKDGFITITQTSSIQEFNNSQPHQVAKKHYTYPRLQALSSVGRITPSCHNLRIKNLAQRLRPDILEREYQETLKRVKNGDASEDF